MLPLESSLRKRGSWWSLRDQEPLWSCTTAPGQVLESRDFPARSSWLQQT